MYEQPCGLAGIPLSDLPADIGSLQDTWVTLMLLKKAALAA